MSACILAFASRPEISLPDCRMPTPRCSRCPTPARPSGTWRTPAGSSRRSCSRRTMRRLPSHSIPRFASCSIPTTDASARGTRAPERGLLTAADARGGARLSRATSTRRCAICSSARARCPGARRLIELGLHHEQQHQELHPHRHQAPVRAQSAAPGLPRLPAPRRVRRRRIAPLSIELRGGRASNRARRRRASPSTTRRRATASARRLPARHAPGDQRRIPRVHRRRRLPQPDAVALRRLGRGAATSGWQAPLYWEERDGALACMHAARVRSRVEPQRRYATSATSRPSLCALGRRAPADRSRMGGAPQPVRACEGNFADSGQLRAAAASPAGSGPQRSCSATSGSGRAAPTPLPGLSRRGRRGRRVQRQVHVRPDGAARRLLRHARQPHPRELPQFLSARTRAGSSRVSVLPRMHNPWK